MAYGTLIKLTKALILEKISQEEILETYLGIEVQFNRRVRNPLRKDDFPGCSFYMERDKLRFKDFATGYNEDCFGVVCTKCNCGFYEGLIIIAKDFNLYGYGDINKTYVTRINSNNSDKLQKRDRTKIEIKEKSWTKADINYWKGQGFNSEILEYFNVKSVSLAWLNGDSSPFYIYKDSDPCYAYCFDDGSIKLYFPLRSKDRSRFINNSSVLQGYSQLPKRGKTLIVTKSYKDVIATRMFGIYGVAPQAESSIITREQYEDLSRRFNNIYSLYDFDYAGIRGACKMRREFGIEPLFFTNGRFKTHNYEFKDFTEGRILNGYMGMIDIIDHCGFIIEYKSLIRSINEIKDENYVPF